MLNATCYDTWGNQVAIESKGGGGEVRIYDEVLDVWLTINSLRVLRLCPIDTFFTSPGTGLQGSVLASLARKGYLNVETTKDGLGIEYYLNNHGHRLRGMHASDFPSSHQ